MNDRITTALDRLFDRHRIVFWYDAKRELRNDFESLNMSGIEKIELDNNEFGVKYRILREQPDQKFLLYREGPQPADLDNWLLDVQLAHTEFKADQAGLWLSELGLDIAVAGVVQQHPEFHQSGKRREALKKLLDKQDTEGKIRLKMLAVCAGSDARLDNILEMLLDELASRKADRFKLIARCSLDGYLWDMLERCYGYVSVAPGVEDFAIELFKSCYAKGTDGQQKLNDEALVFLNRWKDSRRFESAFETLSNQYAEELSIASDLEGRDYRTLVDLDYFRIIDQKIISDLVKAVTARTISSGDCTLLVRRRRQSHWHAEFVDIYEAIDAASQFMDALASVRLEMGSAAEGVDLYARIWFRIDQLYRRFVFHLRRASEATLLAKLAEQVDNLYSNNFLLRLNDQWQAVVDAATQWPVSGAVPQNRFFETWVRPFLKKQQKVFVIVSDAMRYEVGEELLGLIRQEDRYDAELSPAIAMLPSYTQLGMAALLPHNTLELSTKVDDASVQVDGRSSQGVVNRSRILNAEDGWTGKAILAEDFLAMQREGEDGYRALFSQNDVVYLYHNRIDAVGDKRDTEERVFEAARESLDELVKIIRKLSTANVTNMIVTADHGFLYQNRPLDESDFMGADPQGAKMLYIDRRFVLGNGLMEGNGFKKFSAQNAGLVGETEILIPKSINRLRRKGSGSRFVHGGASLQESVIPVVQINKKRKSDLGQVGIQILSVGSSTITAGQMAVVLYQTEPVSDKMQPRTLTAGLYTRDGVLISDSREMHFDLTSENPRERELKAQFILTREAEAANGQDVYLKLTEKIGMTTHPKEYGSQRYTLRRSFTSDFDL